jgi:hypothetical protein
MLVVGEAGHAADSSTNPVTTRPITNIATTMVVTTTVITTTIALTTNQVIQSGPAATNSLKRFGRLITPSNCELMGFASTNEVSQAVLGEPLQVYHIIMKDLTNYNASKDFKGLLTPVPRIIYPIVLKTGAVSSTTLRLEKGNWKAASWGQPQTIRELARLKNSLLNDQLLQRTRASDIFAVEVPIVGLWMVGFIDRTQTPVLFTSANILSPRNSSTNHVVSRGEMQVLANRARSFKGGSN